MDVLLVLTSVCSSLIAATVLPLADVVREDSVPISPRISAASVCISWVRSLLSASISSCTSLIAPVIVDLSTVCNVAKSPNPLTVIVPPVLTRTEPSVPVSDDFTTPSVVVVATAFLMTFIARMSWSCVACASAVGLGVIPPAARTLFISVNITSSLYCRSFCAFVMVFHNQFHQLAGNVSSGMTPFAISSCVGC